MKVTIDYKKPNVIIKHPFNDSINKFLYEHGYYAMWNKKAKHREINISRFPIRELIDRIDHFISVFTDKGANFDLTDDYSTFVVKSQEKNKLKPSQKKKRQMAKAQSDVDLVIPELTIDLFPYQKVGVKFIEAADGCGMIFDQPGLGKAQPLDAKILTPTGFTTMGDIKVGDSIIGSNGKPTGVTGVFPQGSKEVFAVTFSDQSSTECCEDHLWKVYGPKNGGLWKRKERVLSLKEIQEIGLTDNQGKYKHYIPVVEAVQFPKQDLPIHPYLLGFLIGDGGITTRVTFSTADHDIVPYLESLLPDDVKITKTTSESDPYGYRITSKAGVGKSNSIMNSLRDLGLMGKKSETKFIPVMYKYSSIEDRELILQGILDTDGSVRKKDNAIEYGSSSPQLITDVVEVINSLGGTTGKGGINFKKTTHLDFYRITATLPNEVTPFKLARKTIIYRPREKYFPTRILRTVESLGTKECQCISVDAENSLYVTDDYIVTHNTIQSIAYATKHNLKALVVCPASLKYNWANEISKFTDANSFIIDSKMKGMPLNFESYNFVMINYDIVSKFEEHFIDGQFDLIILDEGQAIKSYKAKRTQGILKLKDSFEHKIILTGTPLLNRPQELFTLLNFIRPEEWNSFWPFAQRYCLPGDAPVLMSDLTERPIKNLKVGDKLVGWAKGPSIRDRTTSGNYCNKLCESEVLALSKKSSVLQKVTFSDDKEIYCTPDHKWLSGNTQHKGDYAYRRADIRKIQHQKNDEASTSVLVKIFDPPKYNYTKSKDYWQGYVIGFLEGDGYITKAITEKFYPLKEKITRSTGSHRVGFACKDIEPIDRIQKVLDKYKLNYTRTVRSDGLHQILGSTKKIYDTMFEWSELDTKSYWAGWLGGIYDAEGSGSVITQDKEINPITYKRIQDALTFFDFDFHSTKKAVSLHGGRNEMLRFWGLTKTTLIRKMKAYFYGSGGKFTQGKAHITGVELLDGEHDVYTLTTTTGNYVAYGLASKNCNLKRMPWGPDYSGSSNELELHEKISPYYIRRLKKDVLKDLPPKLQTSLILELSPSYQKDYNRMLKDYVKYLVEEKQYQKAKKAQFNEQLVKLGALKQLCIEDKLEKLDDILSEFVENDQKVVIFSQYANTIDKLIERYPDIAVKVTGAMSTTERNKSVTKFKEDPKILFFLGTIGAAGVGLTLTEASNVVIIDLPWTPAELEQAEDRCHRIGTKNTVNVYYLISKDTIDVDIQALLSKKKSIADVILDGKEQEANIEERAIVHALNDNIRKQFKK